MNPVTHDRLRSGRDISRVLRGRRQRAGRLLVLHVRTRKPRAASCARIAVIASKRVGNAVARNRAKRLLREAARRMPLSAGLDVVLVARPACAKVSMPVVEDELRRLADQLGATSPVGPVDRPGPQLVGSGSTDA